MTYTVPVGLPDPTPYLLPEEKLRFVVRRHHPIVLVPAAAIAVVVLIIALLMLTNAVLSPATVGVALLVIAGGVLYFAYRWMHWRNTVLVVTNRRLFELVALGIKRVTVMPIMRQSVVFRQGPLGRALGFATVQVQSATGAVLYNFNLLADPIEFRDQITNVAA
ncbi:MAG TPA: PH domain-containing protein [Euzebyales bacterium]